jgi:hypothetical protein
MAEYAALMASRDGGALDDAAIDRQLSDHLNGCVASLDAADLRTHGPVGGNAVYDCGVVAQWAADLKARHASAGRRDIFDVWRRLFAESRRHGRDYDADGFLRAADSDDPLGLLMKPGLADRWPRFIAGLVKLGARIDRADPAPSPDTRRQVLLMHLLSQVCAGTHGFYGGNPIKLDTGTRCGPLNGDPWIDSVAGFDVLGDPGAAFIAARERCQAQGDVDVAFKGAPVATVTCKTPLPDPPVPESAAWAVAGWR